MQVKAHVLGEGRKCDCYFVSSPPSDEELDPMHAAYIFTPAGLFYFDRTSITPILITPEKLEALKTKLGLTADNLDKPPKELSDVQQAMVTAISNHTQGREAIPLECQQDHASFALLISNCWKQRATERLAIEQAAALLQKAKSAFEAKGKRQALAALSYEGNLDSKSASSAAVRR